MRPISLVLLCIAFVPSLAADKKPLTKEESAKVIEAAIRKSLKKPTGELTKADLEKVRELYLVDDQLTDVKWLEKLQSQSIDRCERAREAPAVEDAVAHCKSSDRCEGAGEAYAVKVSISQSK